MMGISSVNHAIPSKTPWWGKSCFYRNLDMNTKLARVFLWDDQMRKDNSHSSFEIRMIIILFPRCFLQEIANIFSVFLYRVIIETLENAWENSRKLWKHSPAGRVLTVFLILSGVHLCSYDSTGTLKMFSIFFKVQVLNRLCLVICCPSD